MGPSSVTWVMYDEPAGVLTGIAVALAVGYVGRSVVPGLPSPDIRTLAVVPGALAVVMAVSAILPLRRALRVNPTIALRAE